MPSQKVVDMPSMKSFQSVQKAGLNGGIIYNMTRPPFADIVYETVPFVQCEAICVH